MKTVDPYNFLKNLLVKKGKSDLEGVVLTAVNVQADALTEYGYEVSLNEIERDIDIITNKERAKWDRFFVNIKTNPFDMVYPITFSRGDDDVTIFFLSNLYDISCLVFIPIVLLDEFQYEVVTFQKILKEVAGFAGRTPDSIKFTIGMALTSWDELVELGHAEEIEIPH
jgi:hypothetical protein